MTPSERKQRRAENLRKPRTVMADAFWRALVHWSVQHVPPPDGRQLEWHRSAAQAAELAMAQWVRIQPNMSLGAYEVDVAGVTHSDPVWPEYRQQLREREKLGELDAGKFWCGFVRSRSSHRRSHASDTRRPWR